MATIPTCRKPIGEAARGAIRGFALGVALMLAAGPVRAACPAEDGDSVRAQAVATDGTVTLEDGRRIVLAEIHPLRAFPSDRSAADGLLALLAGREARFVPSASAPDRHGRLRGWLMTGETSAQAQLVAAGLAVAAPTTGQCQSALREAERAARTGPRGAWAGKYGILAADRADLLLEKRGQYVVIQGVVLSARAVGPTVYVNFGSRRDRALTATFPVRAEKDFAAAGFAPAILARRTLRVRGWMELRGGPWIQVSRVEQIERADE